LEDAVEAIVAEAGGEITTQRGKKVIELKPTGTSKGVAVSDLMEVEPFPGRIPLAIGDDITDESMFSAVNALAGITIRVGPPDRPTEAKFRVDEPENVRKWLASLP
jgi:trehalose 6-phosphate phosphatase